MSLKLFDEVEAPSRLQGPTQVVDREEMIAFAETWDPLPIHVSEAAARPLGGITASGAYLIAFRIRLIHRMEWKMAVIASFGLDEVRFRKPVHGGDALTLMLDFESKRPSASKPDRGVVTVRQSLVNQDGDEVLSARDSVLVRRTPD